MLLLLVFAGVNAQEKKGELKAGDQSPVFKYTDINGKEVSLNDLKGKYVYIDVWATWCGPCRDSFAFVKPLQEYAQEKDIVLLYLSIDNPEAEEKWKKMAAHYDLKGEHIRIQEAFKQEIYDTFGSNGALYIPHCVIIGKDGKIRQKVAASPEKMEELKKQLEEAIK